MPGETIYAHRRGPINYLSPQRIICSKCGDLLYTGLELETPSEIIQRNGGDCPKCGKKNRVTNETLKKSPQTTPPPPKTPLFFQNRHPKTKLAMPNRTQIYEY